MNLIRAISCLGLALACALGQQPSSDSGRTAGETAHGVSPQYEKGDQFPTYDCHEIQVGNKPPFYSPEELTIGVGDFVRWSNAKLSDTHTVIDHDGHFSSADIKAGDTWCYHFTSEGDYEYQCRFHPWMKGVIHVRRRDVTSEPVTGDEAAIAAALAAHPEAVIDIQGTIWLPGEAPGTLRRVTFRGKPETVRIANAAGHVVPLAVAGTRLIVRTAAGVGVVDSDSATQVDNLLGATVKVSSVAAASDRRVWLVSADRRSLITVDMQTKALRSRLIGPTANVTALLVDSSDTVFALDSRGNTLLKIGPEWATQIAMPSEIRNPDQLAAGPDHSVWVGARGQRVTALIRQDGSVESFTIPQFAPVLIAGVRGRVLAADNSAHAVLLLLPPTATTTRNGEPACSDMKSVSRASIAPTSEILLSKGATR